MTIHTKVQYGPEKYCSNANGDFLGTDKNYCHIGATQDALICSTSKYVHQPMNLLLVFKSRY
jgi:hypothetical protein